MKKLGIHPLFLLLGVILFCLGLVKIFFIYLLVVFLHELSHAFVAKKLGYKLEKISLLPFGAQLSIKQNFMSSHDEICVSLAGPAMNLMLAVFTVSLWWIEPVIFNFTQEFVFANIMTAFVNLLPCYPLDGGRICIALLSEKFERGKASQICFCFNYFFSFVFLACFAASLFFEFNLTLGLMAFFIFFGTVDDKRSGEYLLQNMKVFKNINHKNIIQVKSFAVKFDTPIYQIAKELDKNKYNIIYVIMPNNNLKILSEKNLERIFIAFAPDTKISEVFKK